MFFIPFLFSGIPGLALGILKMLIHVCFLDLLQPAVKQFVPGMTWLSAGLHSKCSIFRLNVCHLQVLAMYVSFHFISITLFSVGLTNSYSKITNKYQLKQKI